MTDNRDGIIEEFEPNLAGEYRRAMEGLRFSEKGKRDLAAWLQAASAQMREEGRWGHGDRAGAGCAAPLPPGREDAAKQPGESGAKALAGRSQTMGEVHAGGDAGTRAPISGRTGRRIALGFLVAAVLATAGIAVAASTRVSGDELLARVLGADRGAVEASDVVDDRVDASASSGGCTLTVDSVVADGSRMHIACTIARDDGLPFEGVSPQDDGFGTLGMHFDALSVDIGDPGQVRDYGVQQRFFDAEPSDSSVQIALSVGFEEAIPPESGEGQLVRLSARGLSRYDAHGNRTQVSEGAWEMSFPLRRSDDRVDFEGGAEFAQDGLTVTLEEATLTPMSLMLGYTVADADAGGEPESGANAAERIIDERGAFALLRLCGEVTIHFKDGTSLSMQAEDSAGSVRAGDRLACRVNIGLNRVVDVSEADSLEVRGLMLPATP